MKKRKGSGILDRLSAVATFVAIMAVIVFLFSGGWPIALGIGLVYAVVKWIIFGE